jgi:hypothetical protein
MSLPSEFEPLGRCPSPKNFPEDDQLPEAVRAYLKYARPISIAPDPFHLMAFLSCFSALIGVRCYVRHGSLIIYPSVSSILLGLSTVTGKSEALGIAFRMVLEKFDRSLRREFAVEMRAYELAHTAWRKKKKASEEPTPPSRRYLMAPPDFTNAALAQVLESQQPGSYGSILLLDELASLLSMRNNQFNMGLVQLLTSIHSNVPILIKRAGSTHDIDIELPHLNVCAASTPEWLIENMNESDVTGGWLIRYLLYDQLELPDHAPPSFRPYPDAALYEEFQEFLTEIHTSTVIKDEWCLTPEALTAYDKAHNKAWNKILLKKSSSAKPMAGRALNMILRVALLFEILNCKGKPKRSGTLKKPMIQLEAMEQAIRVVFFYLKAMMAMRNTTLTGGNAAIQAKLVQRLRDGEMTQTEVYKFCTGHKRTIRSQDIREIYTSLENQQIIHTYEITQPGKKPISMVKLWEPSDDEQ